ncbi:MAG: family metallopeptidase [Alphaproteobacteria bacterium]|nr:family metallopeptidase [Alphaproteobacteria bacterium]
MTGSPRRGRAAALAALLCASGPLDSAIPQPPALPAAAAADGFSFSGGFVQGGLVKGHAPPGTVKLTLDGKPIQLAGDGRFILGFDRDQAAGAILAAQNASGTQVQRALRIAARGWRIEHIDVARRPGAATDDYLARRAIEVRRIEAARSTGASAGGWAQPFILPVRGRISGLFGSQRFYRGQPAAFHSGLDIAPGAGATVVAPADGLVVLAGPPMFSLEGNLVIIDHGMGLNSAFLHLATTAVRAGQRVAQGDRIGTVGASGRATGPHLHWSVKWNDARLDPQALVPASPD